MKQAKVLSDKELSKLFKVCELTTYPCRNRLIVAFSFYAGLRAIEIASLKIGDVFTEDNEVNDTIVLTKQQTKGSKSNVIHVGKKLQREIHSFVTQYPHITRKRESRRSYTIKIVKAFNSKFFIYKSLLR